MDQTELRDKLSIFFNLQELHNLCFDLKIMFENLSGDTREEKARELVEYCFRHGQIQDLVEYCQKMRPHVSWEKKEIAPPQRTANSPSSHSPSNKVKTIEGRGSKLGSKFDIIPNPLSDDDVLTLARKMRAQKSRANDPNIIEWAKVVMLGPRPHNKSIEGYWSSRWRTYSSRNWNEGTARIQLIDEWVHIHYEDNTNEYLIKAHFDKNENMLTGRYLNVNIVHDSTPWVGIIVDNRRIDGFWESGRWDFRR